MIQIQIYKELRDTILLLKKFIVMTSDGITKRDWDKIHKMAVEIVNHSVKKDKKSLLLSTKNILTALDKLEVKYGDLPSILATRADYTQRYQDRLRLLRAAFTKAVNIHDFKNQLLIATSLAENFTERKISKSALKWLATGKKLLKKNYDKGEAQTLKSIAKKLKNETTNAAEYDKNEATNARES